MGWWWVGKLRLEFSYKPAHGHVLVCTIHSHYHEDCYLLTLFAILKRNTRPKGLQLDALLPYTRYRWRCDLCKSWRQQAKEAGAPATVLWRLEQVRDFPHFVWVFRVDRLADREEEELYAKYHIHSIFQTYSCFTFTSTA